MRLGFFGGSFDPPHRGHLAVALAAAQAFSLDRVLLAPTANQPLKPQGPRASFEDRLAMVRLLCACTRQGKAPHLEASALDAPTANGGPNYTVDTLRQLRTTLMPATLAPDPLAPADDLFVIVGIDAFLDLPRWRAPAQLLQLAEWIVVSRPGFDNARLGGMELTAAQRERVHLLDNIAEVASATEVRAALHEGRDCSALVPASVLSYIAQHHLYRD